MTEIEALSKGSAFFYACHLCLPAVKREKIMMSALNIDAKVKDAVKATRSTNKKLVTENEKLRVELEQAKTTFENEKRQLETQMIEKQRYGYIGNSAISC